MHGGWLLLLITEGTNLSLSLSLSLPYVLCHLGAIFQGFGNEPVAVEGNERDGEDGHGADEVVHDEPYNAQFTPQHPIP